MIERTTLEKQLNSLVARTIASGVKPLELIFVPVYDCYYGEVTAYCVSLAVNSVVSGTIYPEEYMRSDADGKLLADMSLRAVKKACEIKKIFDTARENDGLRAGELYIRCSSALLEDNELYPRLKDILTAAGAQTKSANNTQTNGANDETAETADESNEDESGNESKGVNCKGIYLEFYPEAFELDTETLKNAFRDIRAAGLKVAVDGYGGKDFPIEKVISACPDVVFTSTDVAALITDRERHSAVAPLLNLIKSLGGKAIANSVDYDEELREFRARDCSGFIPSEKYSGSTGATFKRLSQDEFVKMYAPESEYAETATEINEEGDGNE